MDELMSFRIEIADDELDDLRRRLADARWPSDLPGGGWARGVPADYLRELADYWRGGYDWRAQETLLNRYPQFVTEIDGQPIHFLHVRSEQADAVPLLITHGYPSSVAEFMQLIDPLVDPSDGQAFHLIVPSLPGYAFSTPLRQEGWSMARSARAWVELMRRLGYDRYGVHGGDIGAGISGMVAGLDGERVLGLHVVTDPFTAAAVATFVPGMADQLDESDPIDAVIGERMREFAAEGSGYIAIQNSRPQTIGYGLVDSPLLQLAWIAEKVHEWTQLPVDRDQLLTTVSLYWFTRCGASVAHTMYDNEHFPEWGAEPTVSQAVAVFGADDTVRKLVSVPAGARWTEHAQGRHFPAMEAPLELARDLQAFFGELQGSTV